MAKYDPDMEGLSVSLTLRERFDERPEIELAPAGRKAKGITWAVLRAMFKHVLANKSYVTVQDIQYQMYEDYGIVTEREAIRLKIKYYRRRGYIKRLGRNRFALQKRGETAGR